MNVSGLTPIATIQKPDESSLTLRMNQRINAEVLQVAGERVLLALEGVRVVAKLTSSEQAAALAERRFAQFIVRDLSEPTVMLQLIQPGRGIAPSPGSPRPDLIQNLLEYSGLPTDEASILIARALLNNGLLIAPELASELKTILDDIENWGERDAQIAAALKAAGLPLTSSTFALARSNLPSLAVLLKGLKTRLDSLQEDKLPPKISDLVKKSLAMLDDLIVDWGADPKKLAENLRQAIRILGNSLEHELLEMEINRSIPGSESSSGLMALAKLRHKLAENGLQSSLEEITAFLDGMRLTQFLNSNPEKSPLKGEWLRLDLPLFVQGPVQSRGQELKGDSLTAHLRIAYQSGNQRPSIDPFNTRFILRVDLGANDVIQVDVSVADRRVGAQITATREDLRSRAEAELSSLKSGLDRLGYILQTARCEVGLLPTSDLDRSMPFKGYQPVSVEA